MVWIAAAPERKNYIKDLLADMARQGTIRNIGKPTRGGCLGAGCANERQSIGSMIKPMKKKNSFVNQILALAHWLVIVKICANASQ